MKNIFIFTTLTLMFIFTLSFFTKKNNVEIINKNISEYDERDSNYLCTIKNDSINIRILILKHSREKIADDDAKLAIEAVKKASENGLDIKDVGNHFIDKTKKLKMVVWQYNDIESLKDFVSKQMKINAIQGDTLILFTIGHGGDNGELHNLGQRSEVMKALAEASAENKQKVLWWQLSCYAAAKLPSISTLSDDQKYIFNILATSPANKTSYINVEGPIMESLFMSLAEKNKKIDPDQNNEITGNEFKKFLNTIKPGRGDLYFSTDNELPVFGNAVSLPNQIPIIDRNGDQKDFPKNYIPLPKDK